MNWGDFVERKKKLYLILILTAITVVGVIFTFVFMSGCPGMYDPNNMHCNLMIAFIIILSIGMLGLLAIFMWWAFKKQWGIE